MVQGQLIYALRELDANHKETIHKYINFKNESSFERFFKSM